MASRIAELAIRFSANVAAVKSAFAEVNKDLDSAQRRAAAVSGGFRSLGGSLASAGQSLAVGISLPLAGVAASALQASARIETARAAFETMTGSAARANQVLRQVQEFAARTPFEFPELVRSSQKLLAFGFAADRIVPILNSVGGAVAAVGGGADVLDRVTLALGQISAKGKVSAEELNQLAETGLPVRDILARSFGVTTAELTKLVERGAVPAKEAIDALLKGFEGGQFAGSLERQSKTLTGVFSNLKDQVTASLGQVGDVLAPTAKRVATELVAPALKGIQDLAQGFAGLSPAAQNAVLGISAFAAAVGPAALVAGQLTIALQGVVSAGKALAALNLGTAIFGSLAGRAGLAVAAIAGVSFALEKLEQAETKARSRNSALETNLSQRGATAGVIANASNGTRDAFEDVIRFAKGVNTTVTELKGADAPSKAFSDALAKIRGEGEKVVATKLPEWATSTRVQFEALLTRVPGLSEAFKNLLRAEDYQRQQAGIRNLQTALYDFITAAEPGGKTLQTVFSDLSANINEFQLSLTGALASLDETNAAIERLGQVNANPLGNLPNSSNDAQSAAFDFLKQQEQARRNADLLGARYQEVIRLQGANSRQARIAYEEWVRAEEQAVGASTRQAGRAARELVQVSTITTNLSQSLARIAFEGGKFGDVMAAVGRQIGQSITANLIEKLFEASGIFDVISRKAGVLLSKIPGLGKIFGGASGGAGGVAGAAGGIGTGTAGVASGAAAAASSLTSTLTAIGSIGSAITGVISNIQQAGTNRRLSLVEQNTRGQLNQAISQQETFNLYLPKLAEIAGLMKQIIELGLGVYSQPASEIRARIVGSDVAGFTASPVPLETSSLLTRIADSIDAIRTDGLFVRVADTPTSRGAAVTLSVQGSIFGFGSLSEFNDALVLDLQRRGLVFAKG